MSNTLISTTWNGYCPESLLKCNTVKMRLNQNDFYESEETGLQICLIPGVQAVILNIRGEGKFRDTPTYGHEIVQDEFLSPQNTEMPPFNHPPKIFEDGKEMEGYILGILSSSKNL